MLNVFTSIVFSCILLLSTQSSVLFSEITWQTNYEAAFEQAKTSSKPLLLFFTGSDWCSWCNKLDEEVLSTPEFAEAAGNKFVFVKLDFPLYTPQDPQLKAQNKQIQQQFDVRGYPTVLLIDPQQNKQIGSTGYRPGGSKLYVEHLQQMLNSYGAYKQKMSALNTANFTGHDLKLLYEQAKKMQLEEDANKILKKGVCSNESLFFLLERYYLLATQGLIHSKEGLTTRQQLLSADLNNQKHVPYQVALIEFETYSKEVGTDDYGIEIVIAPLNAYIEKYGTLDKENLWRIQSIISQVYLDHDQLPKALKYAQDCYESAPYGAQPEIARAIQNIRSQIDS